MKSKNLNPVVIQVPKDLVPQSNGLVAWVVDKQGNLIEKQPIKGGQAKLATESGVLRGQAKIYIAPEMPEAMRTRKVNERMLQRAGAYQPAIKLRNGNIIDLLRIPDITVLPFRFCTIAGVVTKNFTIDGVSQVLPVCNLRVHICEVDRIEIILPRIPDWEIIDIRDKILDVIVHEKFPPFPIPDPIPDPIGPVSLQRTMAASSPISNRLEAQMQTAPKDELIRGLANNSAGNVRQLLIDNFRALLPYLCLFPRRWPFLYRCDEIATVQTDCYGRFEHLYFYLNSGDQPDIYIWIEANINGSWETVYQPSKACGTYWNYHCGTDINISLNDARVQPCECAPLPGQVVWMKRVNTGISIRNIQQNTAGSAHIANAIGLTQNDQGHFVSPFGNAFPFVVQFGSGLPSAGVTHYRWKYRQIKNANLGNVTDTDHPFEGAIYKAYTYERINSDGDTVFYTGSFKLGPEPSPNGNIFRIPHAEASVDIPAEPTAEWNQDTYSVNVDSMGLNDGLYEFTFELLDGNGNAVALDKDIFVVDKKLGEASNSPDAPTITAFGRPENYLLLNGANKAVGFRFVMRIDNDHCNAAISDALVDGNPTENLCGFGQYNNKAGSKVTLGFMASQPQNFATYSFSVVKGNGHPAGPTNTGGYVTQAHDGYSVTNNVFTKNVDVAAMLGICDKAAFAENLYVRATHTNGNRRLEEYDRSATAAFAIEPKPAP